MKQAQNHKVYIGITLLILLTTGCNSSKEIEIREVVPSPISEADAIRLTQKALNMTIPGSSSFVAVPHGFDSSEKFARNDINPNHGYVLWDDPLDKPTWNYMVIIDRYSDHVQCSVSRAE